MTTRITERRSQPRAELETTAQLFIGYWVEYPVLDISESGIRLMTDALPEGAAVKLFFSVPRGRGGKRRLCLAQGEVVWRASGMTGIAFSSPPVEDCVEPVRSHVAAGAA